MRVSVSKRTMYGLTVLSLGMVLSACNTTKATIDTTVKFFSSTSPDSLFTADGMVEQRQKVNLFAGVNFENLRQDVASGNGQYLTSLAVLMNVPADRHAEFGAFLQSRYPVLFQSDFATDRTAHVQMLSALNHELQTNPRLGSASH